MLVWVRSVRVMAIGAGCAVGLVLAACEGTEVKGEYPDRRGGDSAPVYGPRDSIFGEGGIGYDTDSKKGDQGDAGAGGGVGVNGYLWRASLDTVSFMPLASADPFGGVIITDWHSMPETPAERFKMNVYILGRTLRADGIRVSVFRQVLDDKGTWRDVSVPNQTGIQIEDAILTRARQLRFDVMEQ